MGFGLAEAQRIGQAINTKAEALAVLSGLRYCAAAGFNAIILEIDSMAMRCILRKEWKMSWELVYVLTEARGMVDHLRAKVQYVFREGNMLAGGLASLVLLGDDKMEYDRNNQLPLHCRTQLYWDKQ